MLSSKLLHIDLTEDFLAVKNPVQAAVTLLWGEGKAQLLVGPGAVRSIHPSAETAMWLLPVSLGERIETSHESQGN